MLDETLDLFVKAAPGTVMIRGVLENILSAKRLNAIFEDAARSQYTRRLAFSSVVRLMSQVVMWIRPSVYAAHRAEADELGVSAKCVYNTLEGVEPTVSREMVCRTARETELVIEALGGRLPPLFAGYHTKILDGNHLGGTDHRLRPLRRHGGAALPGLLLAVLEPALKLITDVFPCEDAYTQERALLGQVLETVEPGDLWIEDRNFCTTSFLFGIATRDAYFLVRQHAQSLHWESLEEPVYKGTCATGRVFEQRVWLRNEKGQELIVRRITIELYQATRDGETTLYLLTNLPAAVSALLIADGYGNRWLIETAFQELTVDLACEVQTLGYPKAALFAFCVATMCYNAFSVAKAALRVKQAEVAASPANLPSRAASAIPPQPPADPST